MEQTVLGSRIYEYVSNHCHAAFGRPRTMKDLVTNLDSRAPAAQRDVLMAADYSAYGGLEESPEESNRIMNQLYAIILSFLNGGGNN